MAKKRFERLQSQIVWPNVDCPARDTINAHSSAIEQLEEDSRRLTKTEGRHRRRMEKIEARLDLLEAVDTLLRCKPPAPEPVVVEGTVGFYVDSRRAGVAYVTNANGVKYRIGAVGDRVRLTIERIDEHDDA